MICFVNAAMRSGGTARAASAGVRMDDSERRRRTVVVWMLILLFAVVRGGADGLFGSGRWSDLALSSISGFRDKAYNVRYRCVVKKLRSRLRVACAFAAS